MATATGSGLPVELRNQLAQQLGYTGEFGGGQFQNWLSQTGLAPQWQTMVQGAQATEQSFLNPADNMWYGVNPVTGQAEPLMAVQFDDNTGGAPQFKYVLESQLTPEQKQFAIHTPGGVNDDNWFDKAMDVVIPGGLAIMGGYAGAGALGYGPAAGTGGELLAAEGADALIGGAGSDVVGGEFVGGLNTSYVPGATPGLNTAGFEPSILGAGGTSTAPGLAAPTGLTLADVAVPGGGLGLSAATGSSAPDVIPQSGGSDGSVPPGSQDGGSTGGTGGTGGTVNIPGIGDVPISTIGNVLATVLGVTGNLSASEDYEDLANQILAKHQPFLDQSLTWMQNPNAYFEGPGQAALKGNLAALSVHGNPASNPWALATANEAALKNWQNAVLGFGNVGLGGNNLYSANTGNAINSTTDAASDLAWGVGKVTNPQKPTSMPQLYASLNSGNYL